MPIDPGGTGAEGRQEVRLDVSQVHYDITSVELFGAYENELPEGQPPPTPLPTYGRTKSGRKNVKQVQLGVNVTGDGGVPVGHVPLDGNAAEATTHLDNLRRLRVLPKKKLLYIADTKLDTPENLLTVAASGQVPLRRCVQPRAATVVFAEPQQAAPVDY